MNIMFENSTVEASIAVAMTLDESIRPTILIVDHLAKLIEINFLFQIRNFIVCLIHYTLCTLLCAFWFSDSLNVTELDGYGIKEHVIHKQ
jgi:hypothetical protein